MLQREAKGIYAYLLKTLLYDMYSCNKFDTKNEAVRFIYFFLLLFMILKLHSEE